MLKRTWHSTQNLHRRFNISPPPRVAARKVFSEEVRELLEEAKHLDAILALPDDQRAVDDLIAPRERMALEAADCIVTICGLLMAYGVRRQDLKRALEAVAAKNDQKQPGVTHAINKAGKIARIVVKP